MKKHVHKHRKSNPKATRWAIIGVLALTTAHIVTLIISNIQGVDGEYFVTADGHVHTADGTHVGDAAEIFGEDFTISEDGHVHDAAGNHVGTYVAE